jgi:hypothetical protein
MWGMHVRRRASAHLAVLLLGAVVGCEQADAPAHGASGDRYETSVLPPGEGAWAVVAPETVETEEGLLRKIVVYSKVYEIDRIYRSMEGPASDIQVSLELAAPGREILWLKGLRSQVVDASGAHPASQEFMCHVVGGIRDPGRHERQFGFRTLDDRFATLSQGQYHKEYPRGFGVPVVSTEALQFSSQVLNHNRTEGIHRVRHKIVLLYLRDSEAVLPMRAIRNTFAQVMVLLNGEEGQGYFGVRMPDEDTHGASCAVGENAHPLGNVIADPYGREFTAHFVVKPGRVSNQSLATSHLNVAYDTTIHTIDTHLHPFAESLELRDLTTQETLFLSHATPFEEGIGLRHVETFSSEEGIPLYADHEYAVISIYDNTSGSDQDAMASFYVGVYNPEFDPEVIDDPAALARKNRERQERLLDRALAQVERDPEDPVAHYRAGLTRYHLGQTGEAVASLSRAVALAPGNERMQSALATARRRLEHETPAFR